MTPAPAAPGLRGVRGIAIGAFALAFAVRLIWVLRVQSPLTAVYGDMFGYVDRAERLLAGTTPSEPRILTIYPWGGHYLLALEFLVLGRNAQVAIAVVHALVGAVPAACMTALTIRLVPSRIAAAVVGTLVALWVPHVCYSGYFLSEIWFSAAIALHAWLTVRDGKRAPGLLGMGLLSAMAFVVRPQFMLTWAIETSERVLFLFRHRGLRTTARVLLCLALPMMLAIAVSSVRLHRISGHWGLISDNAAMNRVWAETDICKLEATWRTPTGEQWTLWWNPPSRPCRKPSDEVHFEGYIMDPDLLRAIRQSRVRGVSWARRLGRMADNVKLLVAGNLPWPESNYTDVPWRVALQKWFASAMIFAVLPLCWVGLTLGRQNRTMLILLANLVTPVVAAAIYFGEARYHVPYDPFVLLLAVVGCYELGKVVVRLVEHQRAAQRPSGP